LVTAAASPDSTAAFRMSKWREKRGVTYEILAVLEEHPVCVLWTEQLSHSPTLMMKAGSSSETFAPPTFYHEDRGRKSFEILSPAIILPCTLTFNLFHAKFIWRNLLLPVDQHIHSKWLFSKSMRIWLDGYVDKMVKTVNSYRTVMEKVLLENVYSVVQEKNGRIILRWIREKSVVRIKVGLNWLRIGSNGAI
jgi:hypothetical protein